MNKEEEQINRTIHWHEHIYIYDDDDDDLPKIKKSNKLGNKHGMSLFQKVSASIDESIPLMI